jgi:hypothetical protein
MGENSKPLQIKNIFRFPLLVGEASGEVRREVFQRGFPDPDPKEATYRP